VFKPFVAVTAMVIGMDYEIRWSNALLSTLAVRVLVWKQLIKK